MSTTDLKLEDPGTLIRPGPIGRLARLGFGVMSIYYAAALWGVRGDLFTDGGAIRPLLLNGVFPSLFLISYVVNIGFSRAWKKWPALISLMMILIAGGVGYAQTGDLQSPLLARTIWIFELYLFGHLGLAFVFAALLGTPGCEMRAFHHLFSLLTGRPTAEHHCPVGPLTAIDRWERGGKQSRKQ